MNIKLIPLLLICFAVSIVLSAKKCTSSPPPKPPATVTPPTPAHRVTPKAIILKNFNIPSEFSTQFNAMMANCPLLTNSTTIVTTEIIFYDVNGDEVVFSSNVTNGSSIGSASSPGDYQYTLDVPYFCDYFVRTTLKASVCQPCCGRTFMDGLLLYGEGCIPDNTIIPPVPDAGKPVLIYESDHKSHTSTSLIESYVKEFKCACDCP